MSLNYRQLALVIFGGFLFCAGFPPAALKAVETIGPDELPAYVQARMIGKGLYSERSEIGDEVEVELLEPINLYNRRMFVPASSVLIGRVQSVQEAQRGLRRGKVKVGFTRILFPNGFELSCEAYLTDQKPKELEGGEIVKGKTTFGEKLLRIGKVGAGAVLGGPVGAAAASGILVFNKGGKVRIAPGDLVNVYVVEVMKSNQRREVQGEIKEE